ncbi:hypothetical protein BD413DRAFT_563167 [Trametes elegans]|nr:hypothetical protein BD413DRAFT_563167 [Trametes elegans]
MHADCMRTRRMWACDPATLLLRVPARPLANCTRERELVDRTRVWIARMCFRWLDCYVLASTFPGSLRTKHLCLACTYLSCPLTNPPRSPHSHTFTTMSHVSTISWSTVLGLFNAQGLYQVGYSWLFGMSLWVTFIGGTIAHRTLPRQQFGTLQHRTFPIYFVISILLSTGLLGLWTYSHPAVRTHYLSPSRGDVAQAYALVSVLLSQVVNHYIIGPLTSKTMFQRHRLEKQEGKSYNEPGVSDEMKALNKTFAKLHGISSLANLTAFLALLFHGLWIGNVGAGIKTLF